MTVEIALLLVVLAVAMVLFTFEWLAADVVGLGLVVVLVLLGLLPAERACAGFGSEAVITILGLLLLSAGLVRTGIVDRLGRVLLRHTGERQSLIVIALMVAGAVLSSFLSNTATTAFLMPVAVGLAGRAKVGASRLLMPLAFATILASSVTLIATSTNIVVSGLMVQSGLEPLSMFELTPVGVPVAVAGIVYMVLIGVRLIPERQPPGSLTEEFGLSRYLTEVLVLEKSPLVGRSLAEAGLGRDLDLTVLHVVRGERYLPPRGATLLESGDILLVEGRRDDILKVKDVKGIEIRPDVTLSDVDLEREDLRLVEVLVPQTSPLIGTTLKQRRFRESTGLQVLAINRHRQTIRSKISDVRLRLGDMLLVQGAAPAIAALELDYGLRVLGAVSEERFNTSRAPVAVALFVGSVIAAGLGLVSIPIAVLAGAVGMFVTGCIAPEEAYRAIEWKVVILIGSMLALGAAMDETGAAAYLADRIAAVSGDLDPRVLLTAFFALTMLLTQPMSNQAAAVVVLPIAIGLATHMGLNPRAFAIMIAVAASCSFVTPLEPACLLVYGPGRYRFLDFSRVGGLLTLVVYAIAIVLVPMLWPLRG